MWKSIAQVTIGLAIGAFAATAGRTTPAEVDAKIIIASAPIMTRMEQHELHDERVQDSTLSVMREVLTEVKKRPRLSIALGNRANGK